MEKLSWSALEYEKKERGKDWFWALGIIVVTSSIASIIYSNYFFAILLLLSGILLGFFAIKAPDVITYELNEKGVKIKNQLYPYENIKSFWVQTTSSAKGELLDPTFFIKSRRVFMPIISIPIGDALGSEIREVMIAKNIPEEEMKQHASEKVMEVLGF